MVDRLIERCKALSELIQPTVAAGPFVVRLIPRLRTAIGAARVGDRRVVRGRRLAMADPPGRRWIRHGQLERLLARVVPAPFRNDLGGVHQTAVRP